MLVLNSKQLKAKLRAWIQARMIVFLVGPPGTGKTYTSFRVAESLGLVEGVNGGDESDWKSLFPYKTPNGVIELGKALRASGYELHDGELVKTKKGGCLVVDEANRVPPELKSAFQLLASERKVPWPEGGMVEIDLAIVSTGNLDDIGVEEAAKAELDRYDAMVKLAPTDEEQAVIISGQAEITMDSAMVIQQSVVELSGSLDPKKFHLPEGLRMGISLARLIKSETLGFSDAFRTSAQRCFPMGRRGAEKNRAEFDSVVADQANKFAGKMANIGGIGTIELDSSLVSEEETEPQQFETLAGLLSSLADCTISEVSSSELPLPKNFSLIMHVFITCFGLGVAKHLSERKLAGAEQAERAGVVVNFAKDGKEPMVTFRNVDRNRVERFCKACVSLM